ncbi:MAG TPA: response regulator [Candidatus Deferrimicrobiaceae bacterium]|nr:response regulator [Candidatus Deferrimicrobiaceae bacterium]
MASSRILVVVDDEHARGLLVAVLRADGHAVDAAANRAEALSAIDRHAYTVVLGALRMPGLDGPELVHALEERHPLEMPALIFLARPAFAPDLAHFLMESAAGLLEWPARPADISRIVARSLAPTLA